MKDWQWGFVLGFACGIWFLLMGYLIYGTGVPGKLRTLVLKRSSKGGPGADARAPRTTTEPDIPGHGEPWEMGHSWVGADGKTWQLDAEGLPYPILDSDSDSGSR